MRRDLEYLKHRLKGGYHQSVNALNAASKSEESKIGFAFLFLISPGQIAPPSNHCGRFSDI
jgi:hypothetical protein